VLSVRIGLIYTIAVLLGLALCTALAAYLIVKRQQPANDQLAFPF